ncbi:MAG: proprotein convertase P-domain-containing protein [Planctomycetales bacterium]|nr:proprotein convertase P-domain-containing protein [Planctomycetales bacterium]
MLPFLSLRRPRGRSVATSHRSRSRRWLGVETLEIRTLLAVDIFSTLPTDGGGGQGVTAILPDLFPAESEEWLNDYYIDGNLLRFSTALANAGPGDLDLWGGELIPGGDPEQVYQIIEMSDGSVENRLAGVFTYHPSHGHLHFDGYAEYNLRERGPEDSVGDVVATGGKVSFCLIDIAPIQPNPPVSTHGDCNRKQGITAGWTDVYDSYLPDQWINVAEVVDGDYWLEITVDPDDQLLESDETNNTLRVPITIIGGPGGDGDSYEPNDSFSEAHDFGFVGYLEEPGLSIHTADDADFFRVTATEFGTMEFRIDFIHDMGDLDLFVYDGDHNLINSSESVQNFETITVPVQPGDMVFIQVIGFQDDTNAYGLTISGPGQNGTYTIASGDVPVNIPDSIGSSVGVPVESTLEGPDLIISDINLLLTELQHSYVGDLSLWLTSPSGTTAKILSSTFEDTGGILEDVAGESDFADTVIDDEAPLSLGSANGPFTGSFNVNHPSVGDDPLAAFIGENAAGTWTLRLQDWAEDDTGTLRNWGLQFTSGPIFDRYEPNDSVPQAVFLGQVGSVTVDDVNIHDGLDIDFYRFQATHDGTATVDVQFTHAEGDLTVRILDQFLNEITSGQSGDDNETVQFPVAAGFVYYAEVSSEDGQPNSYSLAVTVPQVPGDFSGDGQVTALDIDLLFAEVRNGTNGPQFDLTGDSLVNAADADRLILQIIGTQYGDANLDFMVDGNDYAVWQTARFSTDTGWAQANFNFDQVTDVSDFNVWFRHRFTSAQGAASQSSRTPAAPASSAATLVSAASLQSPTIGPNGRTSAAAPAAIVAAPIDRESILRRDVTWSRQSFQPRRDSMRAQPSAGQSTTEQLVTAIDDFFSRCDDWQP